MKILPAQYYQKGQALLIVLLGMAVVLTLVLSIVSRSITDVSITKKDEEALRAFSAAEAGIEQLLLVGTGTTSGEFAESSSSYSGSVSNMGSQPFFNLPNKLRSMDTGAIWFVSHNDSGDLYCSGNLNYPCFAPGSNDSLSLCWGETGVSPAPALELSVYYDSSPPNAINGDYSTVRVVRLALDPDSTRRDNNNFSEASEKSQSNDCEVGGIDYGFGRVGGVFEPELRFRDLGISEDCLVQSGCLLFAAVKMFYNTIPQGMGIVVKSSLPSQGKQIESTGASGEATRKIQTVLTYAEPLGIFENAIFSNQGNLLKTQQ